MLVAIHSIHWQEWLNIDIGNPKRNIMAEHAGAMTDLVNYVADLFPLRFTVNDKESNESSGQSHNAYFRLFMMQHIQRLFEDIDAPPPAAFARLASNRRMGTSKRYLAPSAASRRSSSPGNTTVFPCSRIIFNHRLDTKAQSKSAFYKKDRNAVIALEAKKKGLEYLSQLYPASSVLLPLEALNPGNFTALLRWLGFQNCTVRRLCHSNSNKTRFGYSNSPCNTAGMVQGTCGLDLDKQAIMNTYAYFKQLVFKQIQQIFKDIDPPASSTELLAVQLRHKEERKKTFILGFKEIRYNYESHVHFLKTVFPCSRIIFNHRLDTEAQSKSAFYKKDGTPLAALEAKKLEMERLSRLYPASSMLLPLEALKPHNFTALLQWLGFQNCAVRWLCHSNHQTYSDRSCNITNMVSGTCGIDLERRAY
eukprot:gene18615-18905_t